MLADWYDDERLCCLQMSSVLSFDEHGSRHGTDARREYSLEKFCTFVKERIMYTHTHVAQVTGLGACIHVDDVVCVWRIVMDEKTEHATMAGPRHSEYNEGNITTVEDSCRISVCVWTASYFICCVDVVNGTDSECNGIAERYRTQIWQWQKAIGRWNDNLCFHINILLADYDFRYDGRYFI